MSGNSFAKELLKENLQKVPDPDRIRIHKTAYRETAGGLV
jgi:hypothetical protein